MRHCRDIIYTLAFALSLAGFATPVFAKKPAVKAGQKTVAPPADKSQAPALGFKKKRAPRKKQIPLANFS